MFGLFSRNADQHVSRSHILGKSCYSAATPANLIIAHRLSSMAKPPPDERLVYLSLKNTFKGEDAKMRQIVAVRKRIRKHEQEGEISALLATYEFEDVCQTTKKLLEDRIFARTMKAKDRFPELFEVLPAQTAERKSSEAQAAKCEDVAFSRLDAAEENEKTYDEGRELELEIVHHSDDEALGMYLFISCKSSTDQLRGSWTDAPFTNRFD